MSRLMSFPWVVYASNPILKASAPHSAIPCKKCLVNVIQHQGTVGKIRFLAFCCESNLGNKRRFELEKVTGFVPRGPVNFHQEVFDEGFAV